MAELAPQLEGTMRKPVDPQHLRSIAEATRSFVIRSNKHIGGGSSSAELMAALYFGDGCTAGLLDEYADRVVLSKGHAPGSYYFCLWLLGRFGDMTLDELLAYGSADSPLPRMPQRDVARGIEMSTGALGQGLSFGNGLALADHKRGLQRQTFVILGDGECTEGQIWEAAATTSMLSLKNLTVAVDVNGFGSGITIGRHQWKDKWQAFGFTVVEVDGHDVEAVSEALRASRGNGPMCLLLHTVKGLGLSESLAGTNKVHNEVPERERLCPDLDERVARAVQAAAVCRPSRGRAPVDRDADLRRAEVVSEFVARIPATATDATAAHTKKFVKDLAPLLDSDSRLVFVTPDALTNSGLETIAAAHGLCTWENPESPVVECYIAEQDAASVAAGLAAGGFKPVLMLMEGFVWRMLDSLRESILFQNLPVTVVATSGGLGDGLGPMVQSDSCYHAITGMFGWELFEASDVNEAKVLFAEALRTPGPSYLRLPHEIRPVTTDMTALLDLDLSQGYAVRRDAPEPGITLLTAGGILPNVLTAAENLAKQGVESRVIQVYSHSRFRKLGRTGVRDLLGRGVPVVSVHNGPSSVLGEFLAEHDQALGCDSYGFHGKPVDRLYEKAGLGVDAIVDVATGLLER